MMGGVRVRPKCYCEYDNGISSKLDPLLPVMHFVFIHHNIIFTSQLFNTSSLLSPYSYVKTFI